MPISPNSSRTSTAASCSWANSIPGDGSRSMRSSSATSGVAACVGHTWNPRHPWLTAQRMWARSLATRASLVVPFGVATTVVVSHSGADFGTRFWKNDLPLAPSG